MHGLPAGLVAGGLFLVVWCWLAGLGPGFTGTVAVLAVGLVYGIALLRQKPPGRTIFWAAVVMAAGLLWRLPDLAKVWGLWQQGLAGGIEATMDLYHQFGLVETMARQGVGPEQLRDSMTKMAEHLGRLFPSLVVWEVVAAVVIAYLLSRWLVSRWRPVPALGAFSTWQLPWPFAWGVITGLAALLWGDWQGTALAVTVGENILASYLPLLLVTGLEVVCYLWRHLPLPVLVKGLVLVSLFFYLPVGGLMLVLLGLFDPLLNFRRLAPESNRGGEDR
jgi:hypothetical protein